MKTTLLLEATTTTRAQRIDAAHSRHTIKAPAVIILRDHPNAETDALQILTDSIRDTYTAAKARYTMSAQPIMLDVMTAALHELDRMTIADTISTADEERETAAAMRKAAQRAKGKAKAKKRSEEEKAAFRDLAAAYTAEADSASGHAQDTETAAAKSSHTDAADIIQAAAVVRWEALLHGEQPNHRAAINAAGRAITDLAAAKGYTSTKTKVQSVFDRERAAIMRDNPTMNEDSADIQAALAAVQTVRDLCKKWSMYTIDDPARPHLIIDKLPFSTAGQARGWYSVERRNTKQHPAGLYIVSHYATTAPISLDDYAKGAKDDEGSTYAETLHELATHDKTDEERDHQPQLAALLEAAAPLLTERERNILAWATDDTNPASVAAGITAAWKHQQMTDHRAAAAKSKTAAAIRRKAAAQDEVIRMQARLDAAMDAHGVPAAQRRNAKSRIKQHLAAAMIAAPYWAELDQQTAARVPAEKRVDMVKRVSTWAAAQPEKPAAVRFIRPAYYKGEAETISTPAQREKAMIDRRKAEQEQHEAAQAAKAAHAAAIAAATGRADDYFIKPAAVSAAVFEAAGRAERAAKFEAMCDRMEATEAARKAAEAAAEAKAANLVTRRNAAYNAAIRAAYAAMKTTHAQATAEQRSKATAAAEAARAAVTA